MTFEIRPTRSFVLASALVFTLPACSSSHGTGASRTSAAPSCTDEFQAIAAREEVPPVERANQIRALAPRCGDELEPALGELARSWHNRGARNKDTEYLAGARPLYQLYHERFGIADGAQEMHYFLAEVLWQLAEAATDRDTVRALWLDAGRVFGEVAESSTLDAKRAKESAYASVLAYKNATVVDPRTATQAPTQTPDDRQARPMPEDVMATIAAFRRYARFVEDPRDPELVTMKFLEGRFYWRYNHFAKAVPLFGDIVQAHRDHETAELAFNLLLDSLNILGEYERMGQWVEVVLADRAFLEDKDELAERLGAMRYQIHRKRAETLETKGQFAECARLYTEMADSGQPGAPLDEALYNAGVCHEQAGDARQAISAYERLEKEYPQSRLAEMAAERRARLGKPVKTRPGKRGR